MQLKDIAEEMQQRSMAARDWVFQVLRTAIIRGVLPGGMPGTINLEKSPVVGKAIDFAYEANSQRAFADARDGLKPGQRACLWEMYIKGYSYRIWNIWKI